MYYLDGDCFYFVYWIASTIDANQANRVSPSDASHRHRCHGRPSICSPPFLLWLSCWRMVGRSGRDRCSRRSFSFCMPSPWMILYLRASSVERVPICLDYLLSNTLRMFAMLRNHHKCTIMCNRSTLVANYFCCVSATEGAVILSA